MSKRKKTVARRRNPLLLGHEPLMLGDGDIDELLALTEQQACDDFMSRWMSNIDPFVKYKRHFAPLVEENKATELSRELSTVKRLYKKFVIEREWDEYKFVTILDHALLSSIYLSTDEFDKLEALFNAGRCSAQLKEKRLQRRRRA